MDTINPIVLALAGMIGWPALLAAGVNAAKYFGWLQDGTAPAVVFWGNVVAFVGVAIAVFTGNLPLLETVDEQLRILAQIVTLIMEMLVAMGVTKIAHGSLRGLPVVGFHYSPEE